MNHARSEVHHFTGRYLLAGLVVASLVIAAGVPTGWAVAVVGGAFFGAATGWLLIRY